MTRKTIIYKGLSIRDPAPYGEAGLAWQNNFIAIADTLDSLQGSLDTALGGLVIGTDIQAYSANLDAWSGVAPSADGSAGISKTITITDKSDVTHTLVFKDGLLTSHTT